MTFRVQGEITINGAQAKAEAKAVAGELKKVAGDATGMARSTTKAADATEQLETESRSAANEVRRIAAAERDAAEQAVQLERTSALAAGQLGTITAQFNDIGVMAMAGQSPFQLAIQQGTQLSQVLGPMGVRGALSALGQGFMSLLSPINLVTIGSIAAGAALFQWLTEAGEDAGTFEDAVEALSDQVDKYVEASKLAASSTGELSEKWGAAAGQAKVYLQELAEIERREAERMGRQTASQFKDEIGVDSGTLRLGDRENLGDLFGVDLFGGVIMGGSEFSALLDDIINGLDELESARSIEVQIGAVERLKGNFEQAANAVDGITQEEDEALRKLTELLLQLERLREAQRAYQAELAENNGRFPGAEAAKAALDYRLQEQVVIREAVAATRDLVAAAQAEAVERNQILIFGRDSELVAQNRLAAEREVLAAMLETKGVAAELVVELLASWDAAKGFNAEAAGMSGLLSAAAGAAAGIAGNLWNAVKAQIALKQEQASQAFYAFQGDDERGSQREGRISAGNWRAQQNLAVANRRAADYRLSQMGKGASGAGARSGSAKAVREERDAVADLIAKLRDELAIEKEIDPVKQEMIRYREELKDATAAERAEIEALIAQREREKAVTESLQWVGEQSGDALVDALMGAADAGERLIDTLKRAVLQALLLGKGPLGGLFGGGIFGAGGGLFGGFDLFSGPSTGTLGLPFADGGDPHEKAGMVYGTGGPRDDKVPAWISPGEFIVNAAGTRRHRRLLESINSAPAFAAGGLVGGSGGSLAPVAASGGQLGAFHAHFDLRGAQGDRSVEEAAYRGMQRALTEYRRNTLPLDIRRQLEQPEVSKW